jgi:hypothetical protein
MKNLSKYLFILYIPFRHLLKELLFEMPTQFKKNFSKIFKLKLEEISKIENYEILQAFLVEIGDYNILEFELQKNNYNVLAYLYPYFICAFQQRELIIDENFDEIFEVFFRL